VVIPVEIFLLLLLLSAGLLWGALRLDGGGAERLGFVLVSIACLTIAISGRFRPPPGVSGYSPFVAVGTWIMLAGVAVAAIGELKAFVHRRRTARRSNGPT